MPALALAAAIGCSPLLKSGTATFQAERDGGDRSDASAGRLVLAQALTAPSPEPSAWFGYAVAVDGDRLGVAVAAPLEDSQGKTDAGAAYLFEPQGTTDSGANLFGDWRATRLPALNADAGDGTVPGEILPRDIPVAQWGSMRVALDDEVVVVSAAAEASGNPSASSDNSAPYAGAVYVYDRDALGAAPQYLKAPRPETNALFGTGLALSGTRLAVGAPQAEGSGVVYVFERVAGEKRFEMSAVVRVPDAAGSLFGVSVALDGDLLVVGAPAEDHQKPGDSGPASIINVGAVYVFRFAGGTWRLQGHLTAELPEEYASFGFSVGAAGSTVAIGAPNAHRCTTRDTDAVFRGAAYLATEEPAGTWSIGRCIGPDSGSQGVAFGWSTRLFGDALLVGAPWDNSGRANPKDATKSLSGAAYLYRSSSPSGNFAEAQYLKVPDPDASAVFGTDLSIGNGLAAVGAPRDPRRHSGLGAQTVGQSAITEAGAVYLFAVPSR